MSINYKVYGKPLSEKSACAIGFFDGVHIGHRALFDTLKKTAESQTVAVTFDPHPIEYIKPDFAPKLISSADQRVRKILSLGIDTVIVIQFDVSVAGISAEEFVKSVLAEKLNAKTVCVGYNFRFGADREGDVTLLTELGRKYGFETFMQPAVIYDDLPVSSTRIRSLICEGHLTVAKNMLGEYFTLKGCVEKGRQVGREIGFPTANIKPEKNQILPAWGVYVTYAELDGKKYFAGCNVGVKPTFGLNYVTVEAHFITSGNDKTLNNLYGLETELVFVKKIRDEIEFPDAKALCERIRKDIETVKQYEKKLSI